MKFKLLQNLQMCIHCIIKELVSSALINNINLVRTVRLQSDLDFSYPDVFI